MLHSFVPPDVYRVHELGTPVPAGHEVGPEQEHFPTPTHARAGSTGSVGTAPCPWLGPVADRPEHTQTPGMTSAPARPGPNGRPPRPVTLWLWASVSAGMHVALFAGFGLFGGGGRLPLGAGPAPGDGFGGNSVDIEIAGPEDGPTEGAISAGHAPAPEPESEPPPPEEPQTAPPALTGELPVQLDPPAETEPVEEPSEPAPRREVVARRERRPERPVPERDLPQTGDPTAEATAAPGESEQAQGTGAEDSTAGVPGGDASRLILSAAGGLGGPGAQRALLPNGGRCDDPIAGVWRAQKFRASERTWVRFVLRIRREGDALRGTITSRIWSGSPSNPQPGTCTPFGFDHTWRMSAGGRLEGNSVTFGSRSARLVEQHCPSSDARYAPDSFSGTVDPLREVFESHNNDGAFDIDEPYTFRRVACE